MNRFFLLKILGAVAGIGIVFVLGFFLLQNRVTAPTEKNSQPDVYSLVLRSPKEGDKWEVGKVYSIEWEGKGSESTFALFLIDKSLESEGVSVSISDRVYGIYGDNGAYAYRVPPTMKPGIYKFCLYHGDGDACSPYFSIVSPDPLAQKPSVCSPTFEEYPADEIYQGTLHPIDWRSNPNAKEFQTMIAAGMPGGQNYAGHYFAGHHAVATWGCGTSCQNSAIVDVVTGKIVSFGMIAEYGFEFQGNSRLFVVNPPENLPPEFSPDTDTTYFEINGSGELSFVCKNLWETPPL